MVHQDPFMQKKKAILTEIDSALPDFSPKGTIDELCLPIINLINSNEHMVTTSSCSGRLSVFAEGAKTHRGSVKVGGKGDGGQWLYVTHNSVEVDGWTEKLAKDEYKLNYIENDGVSQTLDGSNRFVLYKYEPFILHVKCRDFEMASRLYNVAMSCGFRESGIGSNNLVAVRINIKLDVPIGYVDETTGDIKIFVPKSYIELLNKLTLSKFEENEAKMKQLYTKIEQEIIAKPSNPKFEKPIETQEEKRIRKRKEGLEKQRLAQINKQKQMAEATTLN